MTNMTEKELMDTTAEQVDKWIGETVYPMLVEKEDELIEIYGEENVMCPYYSLFISLAQANQYKGWTKQQLIADLIEILPEDE